MNNLYLVQQPPDYISGDGFEAMVIAAPTIAEALGYHPSGKLLTECDKYMIATWPLEDLTVEAVGTTDLPTGKIVLASYMGR